MATRAWLLSLVTAATCGVSSSAFALSEADYAGNFHGIVVPFLARYAVDGRLDDGESSLAWRKVETEGAVGTLVLLPGPGESYLMYGELLHDLAKAGLRVYAFDLRGQGLSRPGPTAGPDRLVHVDSFETHVDDVARFLTEVAKATPASPVSLYGGSSGAVVAGLVAARHPALVRRVVLVSPLQEIGLTTSASNPAAAFAYLSGQILLGRALAAAPARHLSSESWSREDSPLTRSRARAAHVAGIVGREPALANDGVTNLWARGLADASYRLEAEAYKVRAPVLLLRGEDDVVAMGRRQRDLCRRFAGCTQVSLPGARHKLLFEVDAVRAPALGHVLRFLDIRAVSSADTVSARDDRRL